MYSPSKLIAILCVVLLLMPSYAGIITDPMAPISYQPDVRSLGPNTTLVNITTPSSSGLSHNKYDEFDVEDTNSNVIFNNSLSSGSPILAPSLTISANPNLNRTASIILNEVTGSSLSRLNGAFEIFGDSAALVFANPNGIVVNGGRFFNAYHLAFIAGNAAFDAANQLTSNGTAELEIHDLDVQNNQQITYIGEYITVYGHPKGPDDMMGLHNADEWGVRDGRLVWLAEKELNNHGSISGDHDIHIEAETVNNIDASIDAGGSLYITANTVNNTRTGFWTEYIPPHWASRRIEPEYNGNYEDKACCGDDLNTTWEYWIDRIGDGRESRLSAFGDLVLDVHTTNSTSGLIAAGDDLIVRGHTFNNTARPLHITNKMTWYYSNTYSLWRGPNYMTAVQATTQSIGDSIFELTGDFNNSGQVLSESGISVTANNQVSDTTDPTRTQSPVESLTPIQSFTPSGSVPASQAPNTNIPTFTSSRDSEAFNRFDAPTPPTEPPIDDGIAWRTQDTTHSTGSNSIKNSGTLQANQSIDLRTSGIATNTGYIDADYLALQAGSFLNELALQTKTQSVKDGKKYKQVQYQELASDGGSINAGTVDITLEGDFRNRGGDIFATDSLNIFAGGDVINQVQEGQTINTWDTKTWYGSKRGRWAYGSDLQSATLASGGDINILTDGIMQNLGSDILATGDVNIFAQGLVEQDWVARANLIKNSRSGFLGLNKRVEWEHVTETSTIASEAGDVTINTGGDFNNRASELHAGQDIDISAKSLNISDDYIQTTNIYRDFKFGFSLPATASLTFSKSSQTNTTHQSSFFSAGRDINLDIEDQLHITGSSITAEENINLQADNIKLDAGSYTDSQKTTGFTRAISAGVGNVSMSDTVFGQEGEQTYIIPTALLARNISTNSDILGIEASTLTAEEQLTIQANHFNASGHFQTQVQDSWSFGISSSVGFNPQQGSFDAGSFGIHASIGHMDKGQYLASNLQAQDIDLNISDSQSLDGVIIGDQEHNVRSDYDDSWEHHAGINIGINGTVSASYGQGDWTLSGGTNNIGVQYKDFGLGGFWGEGTGGVSASAYGASLGLSRDTNRPGISKEHPVWTASAQYGIFGLSSEFQHKHLKTIIPQLFVLEHAVQIEGYDQYCFYPGEKVSTSSGSVSIEDIQPDTLLWTFNQKTKQKELKPLQKLITKQIDRKLIVNLSNGSQINTTPDHEFWLPVRGIWSQAGSLKAGDKLLLENGDFITVQSTELINYSKLQTVYNLQVEDNHNFYVGEVLTHNVTCDIYRDPKTGQTYVTEPGSKTILAEYDKDGKIIAIDEEALNSFEKELAVATLGYNPELFGDDAQLISEDVNLYYDNSIDPHSDYSVGDLMQVDGKTNISVSYAGGGGYPIVSTRTIPVGETLATWDPAAEYKAFEMGAIAAPIAGGLALGSVGAEAGWIVAGEALMGALEGGTPTYALEKKIFEQTKHWSPDANIDYSKVATHATVGGIFGGILAGGAVFAKTLIENAYQGFNSLFKKAADTIDFDYAKAANETDLGYHPDIMPDGSVSMVGQSNKFKLVPNNLPKVIDSGKQGKHILGHNNYKPGKSYLNKDINPQELLDGIHSGKYKIIDFDTKRNNNPIVDFGETIGVDGKSNIGTQYGKIHPSKSGVHIVPMQRRYE